MGVLGGFALLATVLVLSALAAGIVERGPISFPIIFLGLGLVLGPKGAGMLDVGLHDPVVEVVATVTLALVLFLDAVNLETEQARGDLWVPALALGPGTVGVIALTAAASVVLLGFPWVLGLLLGAILSSTDPVVLRDVLRDQRLPRSVRSALAIEAGTNDVVVLPVILILIAVVQAEVGGLEGWALFAFRLFVLGPAAGVAVGAGGAWIMGRVDRAYGIRRTYQSLYGVGLVLGSYAAGVAVGGDGFLAAFAGGFAVTLLNQSLCDCFLEFGEAAAEMSMLVAFVLFGAILSTELGRVDLVPALVLGVLAIAVIRPLSVGGVLAIRSKALSGRARTYIAWFGPRGLNSLLFALIVVGSGIEGAETLFAAAGSVVLVSVLAHGASATPLTGWYARQADAVTLDEERESTAKGIFEGPADQIPRVEVDELVQLMSGPRPALLLDVRSHSSYEHDGVRIPGDIRVPPDQVDDWAAQRLRDHPVVLYCT